MRCDECKWWKAADEEKLSGECRRYAPRPVFIMALLEGECTDDHFAEWPETVRDDWCGEFRAKEHETLAQQLNDEDAESVDYAKVSLWMRSRGFKLKCQKEALRLLRLGVSDEVIVEMIAGQSDCNGTRGKIESKIRPVIDAYKKDPIE